MNDDKKNNDVAGGNDLPKFKADKNEHGDGQSNKSEEELDQIKKTLRDLLLDPDFDKIENRASKFNVFETLKSTQNELKHSNVLAWLCDPNENHGFGSMFVRYLLRHALKDSDLKRKKRGEIEYLSLFEMDDIDFDMAEVYREKKKIDVLVTIKDTTTPIYIAIENKIRAKEGKDQTINYSKALERLKKEEKLDNAWVVKIFLTPEETKKPEKTHKSDNSWISMYYVDVDDIISKLVDARKDRMDPNISSFIENYQTILRRFVMNKQEELEDLCRNFYRRHRKALETINNYKPGLINDLKDQVIELLKTKVNNDEPPLTIINQSGGKGIIEFRTQLLQDKFGDNNAEYGKQCPKLFYYIDFYENYDYKTDKTSIKIGLSLSTKDKGEGCKLIIEQFKQMDPKLFKPAKAINARSVYTHSLLNKSVTSKEQANEDNTLVKLKETVLENWKKFQKEHLPQIEKEISEMPHM